MLFRKAALAAAALSAVMSTVTPASAEEYTVTGVNTGDAGFIALTFGGVAAGRGSENPSTVKLDARCEYYIQTTPNSGIAQLVVVGHATATPNEHGRAVSTGIRCVAYNYFNGSLVLDDQKANEGSVAVQPFTKTIQNTSIVICAYASAHWEDNTFTRNFEQECVYPF